MATPIVRGPDEGERMWFYGGGVHLWKATVEETDGAFFVFEDFLVKGKTTPYHCHPDAAECTYVLEGEILQNADGEERVLGAGSFSVMPPGMPHAFLVTSETARILATQIPGQGQAFYQGASDPATPELEAEAPIDVDRVIASGRTTGGMTLLGPPPFTR